MALSRETPALRYLRPLLRIPPDRLRATLRAASLGWVEDPSNRNPAFERVRIRQSLSTVRSATSLQEIGVHAGRRNQAQFRTAALTVGIRMDRLGFAVMETLPRDVALLGRLWQIVSGAAYPPAPHILAALIARPEPMTLGGAMLCRAGKLGPGWLLLREPAAARSRIPVAEGTLWDNRFRASGPPPGPGLTIAALGTASRDFRSSGLPSRVLASLPALWRGEHLADVPSLEAAACPGEVGFRVTFSPSLSLTEASFWPEYAQ
ncbi:Ile-tRNA lysidine synthase TilS [Asaia krungthepensis NRIC 0535]|uniref:Ile-tRNA lysidine synthase TilS n=2 Tax=Asaia krungthepensis TaxID=220990 RepID=A0ABQ0Q628_9PROT|nr:Ile-tRNA lysidine synthase TilS [Asaia krungthepensis NRIC 0535]